MNCRDAQLDLSAYLDAELAADRAAAVRAHVEGCPECGRVLAELRAVVGLMRGLPARPAPAGLADEVHRQVERRLAGPAAEGTRRADSRASRRREPRHRLRPAALWPQALAMAATILLAVGIGTLVYWDAIRPLGMPAGPGRLVSNFERPEAAAPPPEAPARPLIAKRHSGKDGREIAHQYLARKAPGSAAAPAAAAAPPPVASEVGKLAEASGSPAAPDQVTVAWGTTNLGAELRQAIPEGDADSWMKAKVAPGDSPRRAVPVPGPAEEKEGAKVAPGDSPRRAGAAGRPADDFYTFEVAPAPMDAVAGRDLAAGAAGPTVAVLSGRAVEVQQVMNRVALGRAPVEKLREVATGGTLARAENQLIIQASSRPEASARLVGLFEASRWSPLGEAAARAAGREKGGQAALEPTDQSELGTRSPWRLASRENSELGTRKTAPSAPAGYYFLAQRDGEDTWVVITHRDQLSPFASRLAGTDGLTVAYGSSEPLVAIRRLQERLEDYSGDLRLARDKAGDEAAAPVAEELRRKAEAADRPAGEGGPAADLAPAQTARGPVNEPILELGPAAREDSLRRHETRPEVARAGGQLEALKESYRPAEAPPDPDDLPPPTPARPQPLKALGEKTAETTGGNRTALAKAGEPDLSAKDALGATAAQQPCQRRRETHAGGFAGGVAPSGPHGEAAQTTDALPPAEAGFLSWANGTIQTVAPLPPDQVLLVIRVRQSETPAVTAESATRTAEEAAPAKQAPRPAGR
jgi:hypothetical protein